MNKNFQKKINLENSVQINNGFRETSGDGAGLAFDSKYGIMFCAYMPGHQGCYGESRGRVSLSYFPASQPTNIKFVEIASGNDEYCNNILGLGEGKVRVFYEKNSREDNDHPVCYKDFDFLTETLSEEKTMMVLTESGECVPLTLSVVYSYLRERGYNDQTYRFCEQILIGGCTFFKGEDGYTYGAAVSYVSEVILFRSKDNLATVEFFAIFPHLAQYEFDYKIVNGTIHAIYRTTREENSIFYVSSPDMGKTWTKPVAFEGSIQCRPRIITYNNNILMSYNYFNDDTKNRPAIQQGRTSVRIVYGKEKTLVADLYSKCGIVNVALYNIMNDVYMAYSTSELALEYQNENPMVRGKDAVRYIKLGDLIPAEE